MLEMKKKHRDPNESDEYEAAVSTLYDMLGGYGMQSDDLAQFASRISEEKFYSTEREEKLLMLARKLVLKCDDSVAADRNLCLLDSTSEYNLNSSNVDLELNMCPEVENWKDTIWSHPYNTDSSEVLTLDSSIKGQSMSGLASFGSSVIASGALDGSVYLLLAFKSNFEPETHGEEDSTTTIVDCKVKGIKLRWEGGGGKHIGSMSPTAQDENSIGVISCLMSSREFPSSPRVWHVKEVLEYMWHHLQSRRREK